MDSQKIEKQAEVGEVKGMNKDLSEEDWNEVIKETPLGRKGYPIDITRCVKWLVEDEFTTGQVISPNGGLVIT